MGKRKRFDPFAGSGSTLVAALALGRSCILLDASAEYLDLARRRLDRPHAAVSAPAAKSAAPLPLFPEVDV